MNFSLNHVATQVYPGVPWLPLSFKIPDHVRGKENKAVRAAWLKDRDTRANVWSVWEGRNEQIRVSKEVPGEMEKGNLPQFLHGILADYDFPFAPEDVAAAVSAFAFPPTWIERTLSGNWCLLWVFERKIAVPMNYEAARSVATFLGDKLGVNDQLSQLDKGSFEPSRRFTNSGEWFPVIDDENQRIAPLSFDLAQGWIVEASKDIAFSRPAKSDSVPLEAVIPELEKRYPRFTEWGGPFELGSQGPTFWVDGSTSPKSAIVRPGGVFTFSGHAEKPWWSWKDLLGSAFVETHTTGALGNLCKDLHSYRREYYYLDGNGLWTGRPKEDIERILRVERKISSVKKKGESASEMDEVLTFALQHQMLSSVGPCVFFPKGVIMLEGRKTLNTFTRSLPPVHPDKVVWGEGFPTIAALHDNLFSSVQSAVILSWLHWAFAGYAVEKPESGQALILAGPAGIGKSLWANLVAGSLFGGAVDAGSYLSKDDTFGGEVYDYPVWTADDNAMGTDQQSIARFSRQLKQCVANPSQRRHEKFLSPARVFFSGRIILTFNDDPQSLQTAPCLDSSIQDKLILLLLAPKTLFDFPRRHALVETLRREIPYFARYVLDWEIPPEHRGTPRFGVKAYADKELEARIVDSSASAGFSGVLRHWRNGFFLDNPEAREWLGTSLDLSIEMAKDDQIVRVYKKLDAGFVARFLPQVYPHMPGITMLTNDNGERVWKFDRPEKIPLGKKRKVPTAGCVK